MSLLRENKNGFDIVISDVHMPDMNGFKLLEHIGLEMDLPVISKYTSLYRFYQFFKTYNLFDYILIPLNNLDLYSDVCG